MEDKDFIVQYVGFKTGLNEVEFMRRWTPFAASFKGAGIKSIDLYAVQDNENITFISRNIWDSKTYFENFPTGVAGPGSGGGISVTQFGGYWIEEADLQKPELMQILFTNNYSSDLPHSLRGQCTENAKYLKVIEFLLNDNTIYPETSMFCKHLKTM